MTDEPLNAIESLKPTKQCSNALMLHFLNTIDIINKWQCQRYFKFALDERFDEQRFVKLSHEILCKFYREPGNREGWGSYDEFFDIFPEYIPMCYGNDKGKKMHLKDLISQCCKVISEYQRIQKGKKNNGQTNAL